MRLGYGLDDVVYKNVAGFADPRLNPDGLPGGKSIAGYLEYLINEDNAFNLEKVMIENALEQGKQLDIYDGFSWGTVDGGLTNILCVRPLWNSSWHRYDDTIDWYLECVIKGTSDSWYKLLPDGIYPYSAIYMDAVTHERFTGDKANLAILLRRMEYSGKEPFSENLDKLSIALGYTDYNECSVRLVPYVPEEVRSLCEYAEIFAVPETVWDLRPMIYCYWR